MYKIMTKLHTVADSIYSFYMTKNDKEETIEYGVSTEKEAAEKALELLEKVGYADLRIIDDKPYYLDLIYGAKPIPAPNLYTFEMVVPEKCSVDKEIIENIEENSTVKVNISFEEEIDTFHLIIDEKEYKTGLPIWVTYENIDKLNGTLVFNGITRDHKVELVIDTLITK